MSNRKKILLTSIGGLTGIYISKHLKKTSDHRLIGIDNSIMNPTIDWVDNFYEVPLVKDNNFEKSLLTIIKKEKIDIIIPITSYDMNFFTQGSVKNKINDVKILVMSHKIHRKLSNKIDSYHFLNNLGLNTPKILDINSEFEECMLDLALLKLNLGDPIEAKSLYKRAQNISPEIHHEKLEEII